MGMEEPAIVPSGFALDVEGCSGQIAGATMLSTDGLTSLLCEPVVTEDAHQDLLNDFNVVWVVVMLHVLWAVVVVVVVFTVLTNVLLIILSSVSIKKTLLEASNDIHDEVPPAARTALDETDSAKDVDDPQESSSSATEPIFVGRTQRISTEDANDSPTDCAEDVQVDDPPESKSKMDPLHAWYADQKPDHDTSSNWSSNLL